MRKLTLSTLTALLVLLSLQADAQTIWFKYEKNPVVPLGPAGSFDESMTSAGSVIREDSLYVMWYMGAGANSFGIGRATSPDGVTWTKDPRNPSNAGGIGDVIGTAGGYTMWWTQPDGILVAHSPDGIQWHPSTVNPFVNTGTWYSGNEPAWWWSVLGPDSTGGYTMWFEGDAAVHNAHYQIGYATATNETTWTVRADPVFSYGTPGSWDDDKVMTPKVLYDGHRYEMFYCGERAENVDPLTHIGYATSPDGLTWTRDPHNPVLRRSASGFDATDIYGLVVVADQGLYHMWYNGAQYLSPHIFRIGYAVSPKGMKATVSRSDTVAAGDTVWVRVQVDSARGLGFFAEMESPDGIPVDTLQLFDDGVHGDSLAGDGAFAGGWVTPSTSGRYYVDLKLRLRDTLTFELNNVGSFTVRPVSQSVTRLDTVYTPPGYEDGPLQATVYIPQYPNGIGVILGHGSSRTRQDLGVWCDTLAAHGYTAMTISYYTLMNYTYGVYPKPERAFKTAVQFLRRNAARFKITTGKIVGFGSSEGSIHWAMSMIWDNDYAFFHNDSTISDHLDAAVLFYGIYDTQHYLVTANVNGEPIMQTYFRDYPALRATKGNPVVNAANISAPVLLVHGTNDQSAHPMQSVEFRDSLLAHGKQCQLLQGPWAHEFDLGYGGLTPAGLLAKDTVLAFLDRMVINTSIAEASQLPAEFGLEQNYPNPFNPSTNIAYSVHGSQFTVHGTDVRLVVYDLLGREVAVLVNEKQSAGRYTVRFDGGKLASGVYLYRLQAGNFVATRKLMLLK